MEPSVLIFSSHDRCNNIHNDWIVQRALRGNHRILYLPFSEGVRDDGDMFHKQEYGWNKFRFFFDYYKTYGLDAFPFFWSNSLQRDDIDALFHALTHSEVVILGGGNPSTGLARYKASGALFYNDPDAFEKTLKWRQERGMLTVGFSAGVDQLCQFFHGTGEYEIPDPHGFGLCRNIMAASHFESGRDDSLKRTAHRFPECLVFGIPNDSGLALYQGNLPSGNIWQVIEFIIDTSWHWPKDQHHIKTRHGMLIQHFYPDGRHWAFGAGDRLVRLQSWDGKYNEAFIVPPSGPIKDYWTQSISDYESIGHILATH